MSTHERAAATRYPVSDHCDGTRFFTPDAPPLPSFRDLWRWNTNRSQRIPWPPHVAIEPRAVVPPTSPETAAATWINHSTFLLQTHGLTLLTDPVFSSHCGPLGKVGPRRAHPPGVAFSALPKIDVVLLSHDHYDHCDLPTLSALARKFSPLAITPLGNGALLRRAGFKRIIEKDWWETADVAAGLSVTVTPSQHWSKRVSSARCSRLWGGFFIEAGMKKAHFVGDTAYHPVFFKAVRERLGAPDLALIPIGAYEPRWFMKGQHTNPGEAVEIHTELAAKQSVAMHWGTFCLTDEGRDDPPRHLREALAARNLSSDCFKVLEPGETLFY